MCTQQTRPGAHDRPWARTTEVRARQGSYVAIDLDSDEKKKKDPRDLGHHTTIPVRQKVRCFHSDCHQIIQMEVDNLVRAGFIR